MWKAEILVTLGCLLFEVAASQGGAESLPFHGYLPEEYIRAKAPIGDKGPNDVYQHLPVRTQQLEEDEIVIYPRHYIYGNEYGQDPERKEYVVRNAKELALAQSHNSKKHHKHHKHHHHDEEPEKAQEVKPSQNEKNHPHPPSNSRSHSQSHSNSYSSKPKQSSSHSSIPLHKRPPPPPPSHPSYPSPSKKSSHSSSSKKPKQFVSSFFRSGPSKRKGSKRVPPHFG